MIGAPLLLALGNGLHPVNHRTDTREFLAGVNAHESQWLLAHVLVFLAVPLFVPAALGLLRLLGDQTTAWSRSGVLLTVFGLFGTEAYVTVEGFVQWNMATTPGVNFEQMAEVLERFNEHAVSFVLTGLGVLLYTLGLLILAIAVTRARVVPIGLGIAFAASRVIVMIALLVGAAVGEYELAVITGADVLLLIGLGGIGVTLLRNPAPG